MDYNWLVTLRDWFRRLFPQKPTSGKGTKSPRLDRFPLNSLIEVTPNLGSFEVTAIWEVTSSEGWKWKEYMLEDEQGQVFCLYVELDDGRWIVQWFDRNITGEMDFDQTNPPQEIEFEGVTYKLSEQYRATAKSTTQMGEEEPMPVTTLDYKSGNQILAVELWDDNPEVWLGQGIRSSNVKYLGTTNQ